MPPPNYMQPSYFGAMDRPSYFSGLDAITPVYSPSNLQPVTKDLGLTARDLGTTLNPMQNQLQALQAKIREGASKIEFEFMGKEKGSSQATTPETYGKEEREQMRKIAALNDIKSSTHATFSVSGLSGFSGQQGFRKQAQDQTVIEVQRAIDFAKDATTGGAIVVHTGEWQRPVSHYYGQDDDPNKFIAYEDEDKEAQLLVVDKKTGELVQGIAKNKTVSVPKWHTAESWGKHVGKNFVGEGKDIDGNTVYIESDDYVDQDGRKIDPTETKHLFRRVPKFIPAENPDDPDAEVQFDTEVMKWEDIVRETEQWNRKTGQNLAPEEFFAHMQIDNQILQSRGQSLYHLQRYSQDLEAWKEVSELLEYYKDLDAKLDDDEKWTLMMQHHTSHHLRGTGLEKPKDISIPEYLEKTKKEIELSMRHVHESSSAADARAKELQERKENIVTIEEYGIKQTANAIGKLADEAMEQTRIAKAMRSKDEKFEDLYIAPENWHPSAYGSHPDELLRIVEEGREDFKARLRSKHKMTDEDEMEKLARKHIKTTFDIGHLNMWRNMMERKPRESDDAFQKRFTKWAMSHLQKFKDADAIGHLHLTDNFGFNDEHISIGQGNAPVREFVEWMTDNGYKDFIIEPGSFNGTTIMPDTWAYLGAVNWERGAVPFTAQHNTQFGMYAPPNYIVGSYVPTNEWTLWSQVPLE